MSANPVEANDNDKPITDYGPFPLDRKVEFWPIFEEPAPSETIPVPLEDGITTPEE